MKTNSGISFGLVKLNLAAHHSSRTIFLFESYDPDLFHSWRIENTSTQVQKDWPTS